MIKVGSDFSGVGAFNQALMRLGIDYEEVFACDMDKYARQTFIHNYGEPKYYPTNVYDREIPAESLDIYMTSPPCQAFSLAGKRLGKEDKRGILFFNSHEFIQVNKPRFFIFENVKGLLSDDGGKTFSEWINMLGGKSVNGNAVLFPYEDAVPYHIYWQVLNAKDYGVPQNRERVFIIGIRDDEDNTFQFPKEEYLIKRLKDVLEDDVDGKYFLSEKMLNFVLTTTFQEAKPIDINRQIAPCVKVGGDVSCFDTNKLKIKSATSKGYEEATENAGFQQGVMIGAFRGRNPENPSDRTKGSPTEQRLEINNQGTSNTITSVQKDNVVILEYNECQQGVMLVKDGRSEEEKKRRREHMKKTGKDSGTFKGQNLFLKKQEYSDAILANANPQKEGLISENYKIRRLTPRECFRLMDFPDTFTWPVSDSQAYKQAGNSIVVNVLCKIINNLKINKQ